jgi:hypothetical protein
MHDREGNEALRVLRHFLTTDLGPSSLIFRSSRGTPLIETNVRWFASRLEGIELAQGGLACLSTRVQSQVGIGWLESRRPSPADGSQFCFDDGSI